MVRYLIGRIGQALAVLGVTFTAAFLLLQVLPGDAVMIKFMSPEMGLSADQIAEIRASYGADLPIWEQYLHTVANFLTGNFGYSIQAGVPVSQQLATNLPPTLLLASLGFVAAVVLTIALAALSNMVGMAWLRSGLQSLPSLFISVPVFWLGIMLIQIFSFQLGLVSVISPGPVERLILPVATLAIPISAPLAQILMRNIDEVLAQPFVAVARAKGASRNWVLWKHVARNAVLPTLTIAGVLFVLYPATRPWHDESTVEGATAAMSSGWWVASHLFAMVAFILVPLGLLALRNAVGRTRGGSWPRSRSRRRAASGALLSPI